MPLATGCQPALFAAGGPLSGCCELRNLVAWEARAKRRLPRSTAETGGSIRIETAPRADGSATAGTVLFLYYSSAFD